jgi:hypothetical protein
MRTPVANLLLSLISLSVARQGWWGTAAPAACVPACWCKIISTFSAWAETGRGALLQAPSSPAVRGDLCDAPGSDRPILRKCRGYLSRHTLLLDSESFRQRRALESIWLRRLRRPRGAWVTCLRGVRTPPAAAASIDSGLARRWE